MIAAGTELDMLVSKLPEVYQDIVVGGELMWSGLRPCASRLNMMDKVIGPHDVVLDVGSSLGYFSIQTARKYPDSLVISFESEPEMCAIQKHICEHDGIYNMVICQHRLTLRDLCAWSGVVEAFDTVLLMSVLHHFPEDDVVGVLKYLLNMSPNVIVETTDRNEVEACGAEAKAISLVAVENAPNLTMLGTSCSHLGDHVRPMYRISSSPDRNRLMAYMNIAHTDGNKFWLSCCKGRWMLDGRDIIKGVNAWNLMHFNVVWPDKEWWLSQSTRAYSCMKFKSDVRLWNLLMTSSGLRAIDYTHRYPKGDQAEHSIRDYQRLYSDIINFMERNGQ